MIKIEIVSDVSCPWCAIGFHGLQSALKELDLTPEILWIPFQLNPDMPKEGQSYAEYSRIKYNRSREQSKANLKNIEQRGSEVNYRFNLSDEHRIYNTFDAHRLLYWARDFDLQTPLKLELFDLYFQRSGNPDNHDMLLECAQKVGLDREAAANVLSSLRFAREVQTELETVARQGINGVPTYIFNEKHRVSGAQSKETFLHYLQQAFENPA